MTDRGPVLVDTVAAAHAVGIPPWKVRDWARRGKFQAQGKDEKGRTLYRLRDVRLVHKKQTKRPICVDTRAD